jgi:hypothetical protein
MNNNISEEKIDEYNLLIADYINLYKKSTFGGYRYVYEIFNNKYTTRLFFHCSMDWLLPVINKIESTYDEFHGYFGVHICSNCCTIQGTNLRTNPDNPHYAYFNETYGDDKIQATYLGVVSFIKWWNEYNKENN